MDAKITAAALAKATTPATAYRSITIKALRIFGQNPESAGRCRAKSKIRDCLLTQQ
jgi:hypothetical protein